MTPVFWKQTCCNRNIYVLQYIYIPILTIGSAFGGRVRQSKHHSVFSTIVPSFTYG